MHYNITDDNGVSYSYGFAPLNHGEAFGPGHVYTDDAQNYQSYQYKREVPITNSQFQNVLAWSEINKVSGSYGNYAGLGNNCIDFTYDAMKAAGINPTFEPGARTVLPAFEGSAADKLFFEYMRRAEFNREGRRSVEVNSIAPVNTNFNAARNWTTPRDPLVLDLDNDGIETLAINPASPILFGMDADGVKTGTGWIKPDDALVVLDRNGNGLIDSGSELFGDSTVLQNGPKAGQKAANGFEAPADLDANADGVMHSADAAYASLRLWQDANQDGISQAGEHQTLAQTGVTSIQLGSSATNTLYRDAILAQSGTFTRANGSTGQAGSFILAQNNFTRSFSPITVSPQAKALPNYLGGSGWVRDFQEAETQSQELIAMLNQDRAAADYRDSAQSGAADGHLEFA
jgi:hypothetical protein